MVVRKLRVTVPASKLARANDIDTVTDPIMLAHRLINTESVTSARYFDHKLRMSAMHNVCVRSQLLGYRNNIVGRENLPVSMRVTFDIGNAIHHFLQNGEDYLGKNRLGWWRCNACRHTRFGRKPLDKCPGCGCSHKATEYVEHVLNLPKDIPVSGHVDCFMEVAPGDIRVVDFKTINGEEFEALTNPKPEHCIQVIGYMHYLQMDESLPVRVNPERGMVLYVSKKHSGKGLPFKMFHVGKDKLFLNLIENKVVDFKKGLECPDYLPPPLQSCLLSGFKSASCRACTSYQFCIDATEKDGQKPR